MFVSIFFILIGVWGLLSPYSFWLIGESWKSKDAEGPSTFFLRSIRIIAVLFLLTGMIGIVDVFN